MKKTVNRKSTKQPQPKRTRRNDGEVLFSGVNGVRRALSEMHKRFALEYVRSGACASTAAIRAGYSPATATAIGNRLADPEQHPEVVAEIKRQQELIDSGMNDMRRLVYSRLRSIIKCEISDIAEVDSDGEIVRMKPPSQWPEGAAGAVASLEGYPTAFGRKVKIGMVQPTSALTDLARILGMFELDNQQARSNVEIVVE